MAVLMLVGVLLVVAKVLPTPEQQALILLMNYGKKQTLLQIIFTLHLTHIMTKLPSEKTFCQTIGLLQILYQVQTVI